MFGEYDGRRSPRAEAFYAACKRGGINAEISDDVRRSLWEKYVVLVAMSGATTAMRQTIGPIRTNPLTRQFLLDLAREVVAVGRAHGVNLPADYAEQRIPFFDGWPPEMTTSMHHDLQHGKPLEVRWLSGGVVDLGAQVGVPTPMNRAVRDILTLHAEGKRQRSPHGAGAPCAAAECGTLPAHAAAPDCAIARRRAIAPSGYDPFSLNSFIALVRPILRRSASPISAWSNQSAASLKSSNG